MRSRPAPSDWRLRCAAWGTLIVFRSVLPIVGYRRVARFYPVRVDLPPEVYASRVAAAVQAASRFVPGARCLAQACAARALFSWRGYRVTMRVGVCKDSDGRVAAHAWLLSGEHVILGAGIDDFQQYQPIADFG